MNYDENMIQKSLVLNIFISLLDFFANTNPNSVIFYSVDSSSSILKIKIFINSHHNSLSDLIKFVIYLKKNS